MRGRAASPHPGIYRVPLPGTRYQTFFKGVDAEAREEGVSRWMLFLITLRRNLSIRCSIDQKLWSASKIKMSPKQAHVHRCI